MGPLALPYIILPGAAAMAAAWVVSDWRLAGAIAASAVVLLFVLPGRFPPGFLVFPVIAGAAVGGTVLVPLLLFRPTAHLWIRMPTALAIASGLGVWLISSNPGIA